jgi:hypothetical protein
VCVGVGACGFGVRACGVDVGASVDGGVDVGASLDGGVDGFCLYSL